MRASVFAEDDTNAHGCLGVSLTHWLPPVKLAEILELNGAPTLHCEDNTFDTLHG